MYCHGCLWSRQVICKHLPTASLPVVNLWRVWCKQQTETVHLKSKSWAFWNVLAAVIRHSFTMKKDLCFLFLLCFTLFIIHWIVDKYLQITSSTQAPFYHQFQPATGTNLQWPVPSQLGKYTFFPSEWRLKDGYRDRSLGLWDRRDSSHVNREIRNLNRIPQTLHAAEHVHSVLYASTSLPVSWASPYGRRCFPAWQICRDNSLHMHWWNANYLKQWLLL